MAINLRRGRADIDCGCFAGLMRQKLSWPLVARNLVLALALLVVAAGVGGARSLAWLDLVTVAAGTASLLLAWTVVGSLYGMAPPSRAGRSTLMVEALAVSQVVLWLVVLALGAAVFALARQIGVLHERVAPLGALMTDRAADVGDKAHRFELTDIAGRKVQVGGERAGGRSQLLLFVSPACPMCKKLLPVARSFVRSEQRQAGARAGRRRRPGRASGDGEGAQARRRAAPAAHRWSA